MIIDHLIEHLVINDHSLSLIIFINSKIEKLNLNHKLIILVNEN